MLDKRHLSLDLAALVCGMLLPFAFAPLGFFPLAILIPSCLFWIIYDGSPRLAFRRGYWFGLGLFGVGVSWIFIAINDFGFTSGPVAFILTSVFVAFLALFPALQFLLSVYLMRKRTKLLTALAFVSTWLLFEWIRGWFMTGFPWLHLGYAFSDAWLNGFAPILGVYGLSLLALLSAAAVWLLLVKPTPIYISFATSLLLGIWIAGGLLQKYEWTKPTGEALQVAIVQANLPQMTKWDPEQIQHRMDTYSGMTEPLWGQYDVIMWPENALTILWQDAPLNFRDNLQQRALESGSTLVLGLPYGNIDTNYYSSLLVLGKNQNIYHKHHLVPFGEYVPLPEFAKKLAGFFDLPMSGFSSGAVDQVALQVAGHKMAPSICYEDAFGEQLIRFLPEATVLINGSNNAWYGRSFAPYQHLQIARMRAIETERQSIRSATTGISALINEHGQLMQSIGLDETGILRGQIQPRSGATPYVQWGNAPVLIFMLSAFVLLVAWPYLPIGRIAQQNS